MTENVKIDPQKYVYQGSPSIMLIKTLKKIDNQFGYHPVPFMDEMKISFYTLYYLTIYPTRYTIDLFTEVLHLSIWKVYFKPDKFRISVNRGFPTHEWNENIPLWIFSTIHILIFQTLYMSILVLVFWVDIRAQPLKTHKTNEYYPQAMTRF